MVLFLLVSSFIHALYAVHCGVFRKEQWNSSSEEMAYLATKSGVVM